MLNLRGYRRSALFMQYRHFGSRWAPVNAASAAVITNVVGRGEVFNRVAVNVVNNVDIYVGYRRVIGEGTAIPVTTVIPLSGISKTIIHAAIKADMRSPVSVIQAIASVVKAPVRRRPQSSGPGSNHPDAGSPVIAAA
jgi:hypothetical protein